MTLAITKATRLLCQPLPEPFLFHLIQIVLFVFENSRPPEADQLEADSGRGLIPKQGDIIPAAKIEEALASIDVLAEMLGAGVPQSLWMKGPIVLDDPSREIVGTIITAFRLEAILDDALITKEEMEAGTNLWLQFPDPLPSWELPAQQV